MWEHYHAASSKMLCCKAPLDKICWEALWWLLGSVLLLSHEMHNAPPWLILWLDAQPETQALDPRWLGDGELSPLLMAATWLVSHLRWKLRTIRKVVLLSIINAPDQYFTSQQQQLEFPCQEEWNPCLLFSGCLAPKYIFVIILFLQLHPRKVHLLCQLVDSPLKANGMTDGTARWLSAYHIFSAPLQSLPGILALHQDSQSLPWIIKTPSKTLGLKTNPGHSGTRTYLCIVSQLAILRKILYDSDCQNVHHTKTHYSTKRTQRL